MKRFLLFTMLCASFLVLDAQTITWTGAGDGTNWEDANNWDLLTVPSTSHDVIIPSGSTSTINVSASIKSLNVVGNSTLNINHGIKFTDESTLSSNTIVNWFSGELSGGGTLNNKGFIILTTSTTKGIIEQVVLNNEGAIGINSDGNLLFIDSELNNLETGIIELNSEGSIVPGMFSPPGVLNNYGTIRKDNSIEDVYINAISNNYGTIKVLSGELEFPSLNNSIDGVVKGNSILSIFLDSGLSNDGTFEPGVSPGILTLIGDFTSSSSSRLAVDLNGLNQGTEYDLLAIDGDAIFNGAVDISMGFEGSLNDEFIVATTTGSITQCNLESTANSSYGEYSYEFSVECRNNKDVVLKITNIEFGPDIIWTGAGDGQNWNDPNNWDLLAVPSTANDVIIPNGRVTINNHVQIKSIKVQGNTVMTLNDGITFSDSSIFEENVTINWHLGALANYWPNYGVALTNKGTININRLIPSFSAPQFRGPTFNNEGVVNLINGYLILAGSVANNKATGIIDIQSDDSGIGDGIDGNGTFNNATESTIKGAGVFNISQLASYSNNGTFEPGSSPGTLTFIGNFTSSATSKLEVELEGLNQGVDYDLLAIQGDALFDGVVDITMEFEGAINDEFIVATTTGNINQCNLAPVATVEYNGNIYEFSVSCRKNSEVVLTLTNITLGLESNELTEKNIQLFPNPVLNDFTLRNNSNHNMQSARLIDLNGRVLNEFDLFGMGKDKIISLQNYATGLYLIRINTKNNSITKKIVKL